MRMIRHERERLQIDRLCLLFVVVKANVSETGNGHDGNQDGTNECQSNEILFL